MFERGIDCLRVARKYDQEVEGLKKTIHQVKSVSDDLKTKNRSQQAQRVQEQRASEAEKAVNETATLATEVVSQLAVFVETSKEQKQHRNRQKKIEVHRKLIAEELREAQNKRRRNSQLEAAHQPRKLSIKEKNQISDAEEVLANMIKMESTDLRYPFNYQWLNNLA